MAKFTARRSKPELVAPAWATPNERKYLSDIDNQPSLRFYATFVEFFQPSSTFDGSRPSDPAKAIKSALADALVYYYPIAGRLTELPEGRLVVDCTAEGVVFVEADADVGLEELAYEALRDGNLGNDIMQSTPPGAMVGQYFLFGPTEISAMRSHLSAHLRQSSTIFELISGAIWKCRTAALDYSPGQLVRFMFTLNSRGKWKRNPPVPQGYYGCGLVLPVAETLVADLCGNPLEYAVQLVRKAKFNVTDEYIKSTVDMIASRKWPSLVVDRTYVVSDITTIGEDKIDFGWGKRVGGGIPMAGDIMSKLLSYFMKCKNADGEDCVVVPMYLPSIIMDRFATEISVWSRKQGNKFIVNAFN
ncbi:acyl transferase 1 [Oryza sativa Japonica Group]|uniref:Transferase family protein, expressed n=2 Tax=Oryza sativa subsp. japonica TaxID=39947 RepID=Q53N25_ORYSJ|nr:Transferase family [Oryza sativa Japonica Group]ABA92600.1 Transferase family protein, expressed [Oryza sativa Japonica Group]